MQKFPESFLLVSSLTRNPENHFQTHPRIKALPSMRSLKLHRLFYLLSSLHKYYFLKTPNSCPWQQSLSLLTHMTLLPPTSPTISLSPFLSVWKTQEAGNKGQMPVCDLCLDPAKRDVWIRCVEWRFPWQRDSKAAEESHTLSTKVIETGRPSEGPCRGRRKPGVLQGPGGSKSSVAPSPIPTSNLGY